MKYSQQLQDRLKTYLLQLNGIQITTDEAEAYLDSLASYFMLVSTRGEGVAAPPRTPPVPTVPLPPVILDI